MNLQQDDFALFDLPRRFGLERAELDRRRRVVQAEVHPDRFAGADSAARRLAMQWAVRVNEAYERLKDPLARAAYLCELGGAPIEAESNTAMPVAFLVQQMAWRESLDEASTVRDVEALGRELDGYREQAYVRLGSTIDEDADFISAAQQVRALMFVERFAADVDARLQAETR